MPKSKTESGEANVAIASPPDTVSVKVTNRGDGWVLPSGERLSGGQTVDVDRPTARYLTDAGFAEWPTKIRATAVEVVTARTVLGKGQIAAVDPSEAERLVRLGVAEVVKEG